MNASPFLLVASFAESVATFRGPLIGALMRKGRTVHVAAPGATSNPSLQVLRSSGVQLHDLKIRRTATEPFSDLWLLVSLLFLIKTLRPDVILSYTIKPVIYGTIAAWVMRVPQRFALITGLGYTFTGDRKGIVKRLVSVLYRFALARANKVFFQNSDDELLFRQLGILSPDVPSVVVNGSGVDVEMFTVVPIPPGPPVFLMIGRLLGDKGVREYAEAAARVRELHPEVRFDLVGWLDENPDAICPKELETWVSSGVLNFHGKLADVRLAIEACSVYVLPSYREGTPRTVLEAMAMARPIITTDAPGCRETVVNGENGFLVSVQSVDELTSAMLKFVENPSLSLRMGRRSRDVAEAKYDVRKVNAVMLHEMGISLKGGGR